MTAPEWMYRVAPAETRANREAAIMLEIHGCEDEALRVAFMAGARWVAANVRQGLNVLEVGEYPLGEGPTG